MKFITIAQLMTCSALVYMLYPKIVSVLAGVL